MNSLAKKKKKTAKHETENFLFNFFKLKIERN